MPTLTEALHAQCRALIAPQEGMFTEDLLAALRLLSGTTDNQLSELLSQYGGLQNLLINGLPGGTPWTPTLVTTEAWFDAQTAASITESAGIVSNWADRGATARNIEQTVVGQRPTLLPTGIGAFPAVSFGVGTCLFSAAGINEAQPIEVYSVFRTPAGALPTFAILFDGNAGFTGSRSIAFLRRQDLADIPSSDGGTTNVGFGTALAASTSYLMRHVFDGVGTGGAINAGTETVGSGGTAGIVGSFSLSSNPGDPNVAAGVALGEIVVTPLLALANRQRMEGYLAWRWGIQANLPPGHPYQFAPPTV